MADRFWVGGTGTWDATTTTNWSDTSGGAGGASAPTSADDVYFDAGSDAGGAFTVTIGTGAVCRDITAGSLDFVITLAGSANSTISGSLTFPATNFALTYTGGITFNATTTGKTVTTNGVAFLATVTFDGVGGEWTLGSAFTTSSLRLFNGNLDVSASNYTITTANGIQVINGTFNARSGEFVILNPTVSFIGNGRTFHNVSFTSAVQGTYTITGANTFNDLTFTSLAGTGIRNISVNANQTINGTLTFGTANTAIRRMFVRSDVIGTARTLTADTVATLADVDFRDIVGAGLGTWSGTRLGNCGGNTGITFDAGKDVYRVGTGNWSATQWALTSGGSVDVNNFPLAQDTAIFDTGTTTGTINSENEWQVKTIDASSSSVITLNFNNLANVFGFSFYGDLTLGANVTVTGTSYTSFVGNNVTQTITSAGKNFTAIILVGGENNTVKINGDLIINSFLDHRSGIVDLNGFNITCNSYISSGSIRPRSIIFGTNKIVLTGNAPFVISLPNLTNFSYTGEPRFESNYAGSTGTRTFDIGRTGGATESNVFDVYVTAGSDIVDLRNNGNQFFRNLDFTGFTGSTSANQVLNIYGDLTYSSGMTVSAGNIMSFLKSSGTQTVTSNGKTIDFGFVAASGAGTLQLLDNATIGATRTLTHTAGTIDLNDNTLTTGVYSATGSTARSIDFGTGTLAVGGNFTASGSNYTTTGTGSVSMTSASGKTFAGGGFTYPTLNQGGAGTLTITGANTFADISNTVQPATITFPANTTTSVQNLSVSGTFGNLITLNSSTAGTQWTIAKV
jgi:hypothetical protein